MTQREEGERFIRDFFNDARSNLTQLAGRFVDDPETVVEAAAKVFDRMIPDMAYVEKPNHPMASSVFICNAHLAVYLTLKEHGIDAHRYGSAMLTELAKAPAPEPRDESKVEPTPNERMAAFVESAKASQTDAPPGEFVYETVFGDREDFAWGMNVQSCAICSAFSKHDATELVPYMCATDDVVSDKNGQGLRRTGTIAVGASHCDFRYKNGGDPLRVVAQFPDQIRDIARDD